jgi:hypothetical protein
MPAMTRPSSRRARRRRLRRRSRGSDRPAPAAPASTRPPASCSGDGLGVVGDHHGAAAEHVAGPHQHRIADALADGQRLLPRWWPCRRAGCGIFNSSSSLPKRLRSSARSMDSGEVPMMGTPAARSRCARLSGASARRTARSCRSSAPTAPRGCRPPARLPASAAQSRAGRWCRSRWRRSQGCS